MQDADLVPADSKEAVFEMMKGAALNDGAAVAFIGKREDRKTWSEDDYKARMTALVGGSFYGLAILLQEAKDKFFAGDKAGSWGVYLEESLGMKYSNVHSLILIAKRVLPLLEQQKAVELGRSKLGLVAQIKDDSKRLEFLETVTKEEPVTQVKARMQEEGFIKTRKEGGVTGDRFLSASSFANKIQKLDDILLGMLPCKEDVKEVIERKHRILETFAEDVSGPWSSMCGMMDWMLKTPPAELFVPEKG